MFKKIVVGYTGENVCKLLQRLSNIIDAYPAEKAINPLIEVLECNGNDIQCPVYHSDKSLPPQILYFCDVSRKNPVFTRSHKGKLGEDYEQSSQPEVSFETFEEIVKLLWVTVNQPRPKGETPAVTPATPISQLLLSVIISHPQSYKSFTLKPDSLTIEW